MFIQNFGERIQGYFLRVHNKTVLHPVLLMINFSRPAVNGLCSGFSDSGITGVKAIKHWLIKV